MPLESARCPGTPRLQRRRGRGSPSSGIENTRDRETSSRARRPVVESEEYASRRIQVWALGVSRSRWGRLHSWCAGISATESVELLEPGHLSRDIDDHAGAFDRGRFVMLWPMKRFSLLLPALLVFGCTDDAPSTDEVGETAGETETTVGDTETTGETGTTDETEGETEAGPDCGDAVVDEGEECDEGDANADTGNCKSDCTAQACGDGFVGPAEGCDDGNTDGGDGCSASCVSEGCGNGVVDANEECDAGDDNADDGACTTLCTNAACGDGLLYAEVEDCDDMGESESCNIDCTPAACGDGVFNATAGEVCDGDVGDLSCADEGFEGGDLLCSADTCDYDTSACFDAIDLTFSNCGQTGNLGPSAANCEAAYMGSALEGAVVVEAGIQTWTAPYTATYTFDVYGAQGGDHNKGVGGNGAWVHGDLELTAGQELQILVGQKGSDGTSYDVGGGGGTYVVSGDDALIVAGGGGGSGNCGDGWILATQIGKILEGDGAGGSGGNDGSWCGCGGDGSPGGGFATSGMPTGGAGFLQGGAGDDTERPSQCVDSGLGGFGGGGNGGNGGGGGGGYAGGDGGGGNGAVPGSGGESFNTGANSDGEDGNRMGHGEVHVVLAI